MKSYYHYSKRVGEGIRCSVETTNPILSELTLVVLTLVVE